MARSAGGNGAQTQVAAVPRTDESETGEFGAVFPDLFQTMDASVTPPVPPEEEIPEGAEPHLLSDQIDQLIRKFERDDVKIGEVVTLLKGRAFLGLLCLFSIPFCTPVAIPGMSTPFGVVISLIGLRLAFRRKPWLPRKLLDLRLSQRLFPKLLEGANRIIRSLEKVSKPRHEFLVEAPLTQHFTGFCIFVCGAFLLLPLPIPMTNLLPAATVTLLAIAAIGRDGVLTLAGYALFLVTVSFFIFLLMGGAAAAAWMSETFRGWFEPGPEHLP